MCLCLYFHAVAEGDPHIASGVDGHEIHQSAPEVCLELGDQSVLFLQDFEELLNGGSPCLFVGNLLGDGIQLGFGFIVALDQPVIAFLVFCLVKSHMSVFVDALFDRIGKHLHFLDQLGFLGLQGCEVKGKRQAAGQGCDDGVLLGKKLIYCRNEVVLDVLVREVRCGTFVVAVKFVFVLPDGLFVLVGGMPGLGAIPATAFTERILPEKRLTPLCLPRLLRRSSSCCTISNTSGLMMASWLPST